MDYKKLGFKCGIEIHQQLEGKKLFCSCKTEIRKDKPDFTVRRGLRATAGETGKVDQAAAHEQKKAKYFLYQGYHDITCLVELDEEPPHKINQEALKTTLQLAKLLNAKIIDHIFFMRKTVVDGSNTSGFQRTALVAVDGYIEVDGRKIGIPTICLEEEACQVIARKPDCDVYNLSRLGIPLIEIATDASIETAAQCTLVAAKLGMVLRSLKGVKRGIGSIRQDVNVSIKGGARVEIKGFQEYKSIPKVIENEVNRQLSFLKKGAKLKEEVRKADPDNTTSFLRPMPGAARMYPETDVVSVTPKEVKISHVELLDGKIKRLERQYNINSDFASIIAKKGIPFEKYVKSYPNVKPLFIAEILISMPKEIRKRYNAEIDIFKHADAVLEKLNKGEITKESVIEILAKLASGKKPDYNMYKAVDDSEVEAEIKKICESNKGAPIGALMGLAMQKFRGKIDGKKVNDFVKKYTTTFK